MNACAFTKPNTSTTFINDQPNDLEENSTMVPPKYQVTDRIEIVTNMGTMVFGLYGKDAPSTVTNFLAYVADGFYEKKIFHRIISGFMIQGGGYNEDLSYAEPKDPVKLELIPGLKHQRGVISMARQPDNIHSATAQFFICADTTNQLNGSYSAFGQLESGEDVLLAIASVPTHSVETDYGKMQDVPVTPVIIEAIRKFNANSDN